MIEIVKKNEQKSHIVCPECKCEFTGIVEDLTKHRFDEYYIQCPQCKRDINVDFYEDGSFGKYWDVFNKKKELQKCCEREEEKRKQEMRKKLPRWRQLLGLW